MLGLFNNVFNGMLNRDYQIFSGRPGLYALSFIGLGLMPSLIVGVVAVPVMLFSSLKLIREEEIATLSLQSNKNVD